MGTAVFPIACWLHLNITAIICIIRRCTEFFKNHVPASLLLFGVANFYCMNYCFTNISIIFSGLLEKIFLILIYYIYFIILVNWSLIFVVSVTFLQLLILFTCFLYTFRHFWLFFFSFSLLFSLFSLYFNVFSWFLAVINWELPYKCTANVSLTHICVFLFCCCYLACS